ncbi:hypothetical protein BV22DRAFT_1032534 [Leucogyrophana mollusca]|uniref:Uncharacterized protein n=1 Tax=Leucogyrophana mollusca TaxID=85980 RepID=A0ACB8BLM0_9AGAM|nr:hypothetical protein BV22DRAFT_1032534 [Leucogyrophana mollusca]
MIAVNYTRQSEREGSQLCEESMALDQTADSAEMLSIYKPEAWSPSSPVAIGDSDTDSVDSLFDESPHRQLHVFTRVAGRAAPPIPGLFVPDIRISAELANEVTQKCMEMYFDGRHGINQVMLFGRSTSEVEGDATLGAGLPPFLVSLLHKLRDLLQPALPQQIHALLFPGKSAPSRARQAILNLYNPGEGISPHVDLLKRFDDGILGISFGSGCVMSFEKVRSEGKSGSGSEHGDSARWDLYLPERSILVLSGEARYQWTHGIEGTLKDVVKSETKDGDHDTIRRGTRLSITYRWLLPGADIVGEPDQPPSE